MDKKLSLEMFEYVTNQLKDDFTDFAYKYGEELFKSGRLVQPIELIEFYIHMVANELMLCEADACKVSMQEASKSIAESMEKSRKVIEQNSSDYSSPVVANTSGSKDMN